MRSFTFLLLSFLTTGCATNKHIDVSPPLNSRAVLLQDFEPTGSPCTDFIQVNFQNIGCSELTAYKPEPTLMYIACANPQPGAMDEFSTKTWVFISAYHPYELPADVQPMCGDEVGMVGISSKPIGDLTGTTPILEHPIYEGD